MVGVFHGPAHWASLVDWFIVIEDIWKKGSTPTDRSIGPIDGETQKFSNYKSAFHFEFPACAVCSRDAENIIFENLYPAMIAETGHLVGRSINNYSVGRKQVSKTQV
ncbi:hypothetical protein Tsp_10884 [Trichinella spiralis]|uniref:hypothetical protein n=1 Tax=Trichinella spiralis TaxID=6334 RepID=UPI0001EFE966|nr:hypothetical protein Tsp_10884 [Trichinella spiralis]